MAVVVVIEQKGDTTELLKKYDIVNEHMMSRGAPPDGLLAHYCLETPDGMRVSNVWESEKQAEEGFKDPLLQEAFAKAQMPPAQPQILKVHNSFVTSELPTPV